MAIILYGTPSPELYFCDKSILTVRTSLDCLQVFSSVEGKGWNLESNWR